MVRLEAQKQSSENKPIERLPLPPKVYLPLSQHLGKAALSLVKAEDRLYLGQKIAAIEARVTSPVHASVSGKVAAIQDWPHPLLGRAKAIVIENDWQDASGLRPQASGQDPDKLTPEEIRRIVFEAGIVGLGGAGFPTHIKLNPPRPLDTLIINGAECEPYLTGDYRLMLERPGEIIKGIELVKKCSGARDVFIAIEDNKAEAIEGFSSGLRLQAPGFKLKVLSSQYPQGGERQLIKNILGREVPSGRLPFEVGALVQNVATVFAIYEAVYLGKPLYERIVTVTGSCLSNPKNLLVRLGTPVRELIDFCGPLKEEPAKVIIGGPMMGIAQYSLDTPVIKSTTGIVLMTKQEARLEEEQPCIRCGACLRNCPSGLMPCLINLAAEKQLWKEAGSYSPLDCIECGLCNYLCPARRNLTQSIKRAKLETQPL